MDPNTQFIIGVSLTIISALLALIGMGVVWFLGSLSRSSKKVHAALATVNQQGMANAGNINKNIKSLLHLWEKHETMFKFINKVESRVSKLEGKMESK